MTIKEFIQCLLPKFYNKILVTIVEKLAAPQEMQAVRPTVVSKELATTLGCDIEVVIGGAKFSMEARDFTTLEEDLIRDENDLFVELLDTLEINDIVYDNGDCQIDFKV